jgi:hypothetical protein
MLDWLTYNKEFEFWKHHLQKFKPDHGVILSTETSGLNYLSDVILP